jgi:hypothetical protein
VTSRREDKPGTSPCDPELDQDESLHRRAAWLSERGWIIESTPLGAVRVRMGAAARACSVGCLFGLLLPLGFFAAFMYFAVGRLWEGAPADEFLLACLTLFSLLLVGAVGLAVAAIVLQIMWLLLVREEWEADTNRLEVRRRLFRFSWGNQYRNGALLVEAQYRESKKPAWRLAVKSDSQTHYLIRETTVLSEHGGFDSTRELVEAVEDLLAHVTGWPVSSAQGEVEEAARSAAERRELPVGLRAAGFRTGVDERLRATICPPARGQWFLGIILVVLGGGWTALLANGAKSLVQEATQHPLANFPFLFVMALMLMVGVAAAALGLVIMSSRDCWIVERNLLIVRSRLFGWKSEQQYVDGTFSLMHVSRTTEEGKVWTWRLQVQNQAGRVLKVLRSDQDDDVPRLLGAVLAQRTGWPLCEAEGCDK